MRDFPCGIWSNNLCCYLTLGNITDSPLTPTLRDMVLTFFNIYAAVASIQQIAKLSGETDIEVLALNDDDKPESRYYFQIRTVADAERFEREFNSRIRVS